jgi:RND family efflux transporter MFP subunit
MEKITFMIMVAACALQGCGEGGKASETGNAEVGDTVAVRLEAVMSAADTARVRASGLLHTEDELRLSFKLGGIIASLPVEEGQRVRKGQLLATLDDTEIDAQRKLATIQLDKALRDNGRAENLYRDSVATLEQVQNSRTAVEAAREALRQVDFNRRHATILSPVDGFVIRRLAQSGEMAAPGAPVLVIAALGGGSRWVLKAGVSDREWSALQSGDTAAVEFDAWPGRRFPGVVSSRSLAADPANGTFQLEVRVDFGKERPATGMFGRAVITPTVIRSGYSIPYASLLEADGPSGYVFVTDDRRTVRRVPVTVAALSQERVFVSSGLEGHGWVVTAGSPYLRDGSPIRVRD